MITTPKVLPPDVTVGEVRQLLADDHVHMALIVDTAGHLLTTIEKTDIPPWSGGQKRALGFGTKNGRTAQPHDPIEKAAYMLRRGGRRRLAVVSMEGKLLGLLCLKRSRLGYCDDAGVAARGAEYCPDRSTTPGSPACGKHPTG
ncbi:CBS domain-containing protein [Paenarthrobacter sp. NPDC089675]|uniref:CBS domain-containing protein n=1 Tax=Paenarthrobacter TaxID=1742992 RepID=UPI0037FC5CAD